MKENKMNLSADAVDEILNVLENYKIKHNIHTSEAVYQNDEANIDCQEVVSEIMGILLEEEKNENS